MKKGFLSIFLLYSFYTVHAQSTDLIDNVSKIDSLWRIIKVEIKDNVKSNSENDNRISIERDTNNQKTLEEEYDRGKQSAVSILIKYYQTQSFDDLIASSTKQSVLRDIQFFDNNSNIYPLLSDLKLYFEAKELLENKFNASQINTALSQLKSLNRESTSLEKLKRTLADYQIVNDALKETIEKIIKRNNDFPVDISKDDVREQVQGKIVLILSSFIFNYDFNIADYPHLSDVIFKILKRKQPNPIADISDLLNDL